MSTRSPYRAVDNYLEHRDPAWRTAASALTLLFWSQLGGAVVSLFGDLALKLGSAALRWGIIKDEWALEPIWQTRECIRKVLSLVGIGALIALVRGLHWSSVGIAARGTIALSLGVWCTEVFWDLYGNRSGTLSTITYFAGLASMAALIVTLRALRLLAAHATNESKARASWRAVELVGLTFVTIGWPLLWLALTLIPEHVWSQRQVAVLLYFPIAVRAVGDGLLVLIIRSTRQAVAV